METVDLAYESLGKTSTPPLLILHGFFASSRNWWKIAEKLAVAYHVYLLDLRNHGNSPHHPIMDYPAMTADVLRFMDNHGLETAHVLGHSMGGKCAMWLALNHPDRMNKLVVVDIAPKSYTHSFDVLIQALIDLPLDKIHNRKEAELWLSKDIPELDYRQFLLQNLILQGDHYFWRIDLKIFKQMAPNIVVFPESHQLAECTADTLFIAGEYSAYLSQQDTQGLFSNVLFCTIAKAGHWLHVQQPKAFTEVVENFLQRG